jgi:hypothetical protein
MDNLTKIGYYLVGVPSGCLIIFAIIGLGWSLIYQLKHYFKMKDFLIVIIIILIIMFVIGSILLVIGAGLR